MAQYDLLGRPGKPIKHLGTVETTGRVYEYMLMDDNYVYQIIDGNNNGWYCSLPAWERGMHRVIK